MRAYADSSFIIALYHPDVLTPKATVYMRRHPEPLALTELQYAEVRNSFRLRVAHQRSSETEVFRAFAHLERDVGDGIYDLVSPDWPRLFRTFEQISQKYTEHGAHRFADLLHVACALTLEARVFLTFDQRQASLAKTLGLKTPF